MVDRIHRTVRYSQFSVHIDQQGYGMRTLTLRMLQESQAFRRRLGFWVGSRELGW
jgi:hypothetical protein